MYVVHKHRSDFFGVTFSSKQPSSTIECPVIANVQNVGVVAGRHYTVVLASGPRPGPCPERGVAAERTGQCLGCVLCCPSRTDFHPAPGEVTSSDVCKRRAF